jgi:hypothetical protein
LPEAKQGCPKIVADPIARTRDEVQYCSGRQMCCMRAENGWGCPQRREGRRCSRECELRLARCSWRCVCVSLSLKLHPQTRHVNCLGDAKQKKRKAFMQLGASLSPLSPEKGKNVGALTMRLCMCSKCPPTQVTYARWIPKLLGGLATFAQALFRWWWWPRDWRTAHASPPLAPRPCDTHAHAPGNGILVVNGLAIHWD